MIQWVFYQRAVKRLSGELDRFSSEALWKWAGLAAARYMALYELTYGV